MVRDRTRARGNISVKVMVLARARIRSRASASARDKTKFGLNFSDRASATSMLSTVASSRGIARDKARYRVK
jgi:hypothetical protein